MSEAMQANPTESGTVARRLVPFLLFRGRTIEKKLAIAAQKTTIGSDPDCELVIEGVGVIPRWGAIIRRGDSVFLQKEGGGPLLIGAGEGFAIGPYHMVRADLGTELGRVWKAAEPGTEVQTNPPEKPFFHLIVALGASDLIATAAVAAKTPVGEIPLRVGSYTAERRASERAHDAIEAVTRAVMRSLADEGMRPDSDPPMRAFEVLSHTEIGAVLEELGMRQAEGRSVLEIFFVRFLLAEPVQAFRFRTLLASRFAADARGSQLDVTFPSLRHELVQKLPGDLFERFQEVTAAVAKIVDKHMW